MTPEDIIHSLDPEKAQCSHCKKWIQDGKVYHMGATRENVDTYYCWECLMYQIQLDQLRGRIS